MSGDSFLISNDEEIKNAKTTDVYFVRTKKILEYYNVKKRVWAEFTVSSPPYPVVVFGGIRQVVKLLEGIPVNLYGIEEGVLFPSQDERGVLIPVLAIEGEYKEFCEYETPILGFICHASGILTKAFRLKKCAGEAICLSFGIRRMHPALAPFIDFYSYMGGCDGVSSLKGAESIGDSPKGTMPHSLIILLGEEKAWEAFDKIISPEIPRIALIDTYGDEKVQAIRATQVVKNIKGVRLDTPSSRRGDMKKIVQEIRWELDIRGRKEVMIFVSGGLDEKEILDLTKAGAQGFGVGTTLSNAKTIDYAMDVVEVEGVPCAKKGKFGGKKIPFYCEKDRKWFVQPFSTKEFKCPVCGNKTNNMFVKYMENGKIVYNFKDVKEKRKEIIKNIEKYTFEELGIL